MLDDRKAEILRAVVEEYIDTAQPVGSSRIVATGAIHVSPATVRNELTVLEREGYLTQPHTSAGRIPTDKGYRFFVDQLTPKGTLQPAQRHEISKFFDHTHGALEQMLHDTSRLLSSLTDYAAVVIGPPHEAATIRSVQLSGRCS
jgi:heat-inducible transcriptional repressor